MTEVEKNAIVKEVLERIEHRPTPKNIKPHILQPTFHKWFREGDDPPYDAKMREIMQGYEAYAIWDLVRRATCNICGVQYVRQIKDAEQANRIADTLCQTIYDLGRKEQNK